MQSLMKKIKIKTISDATDTKISRIINEGSKNGKKV